MGTSSVGCKPRSARASSTDSSCRLSSTVRAWRRVRTQTSTTSRPQGFSSTGPSSSAARPPRADRRRTTARMARTPLRGVATARRRGGDPSTSPAWQFVQVQPGSCRRVPTCCSSPRSRPRRVCSVPSARDPVIAVDNTAVPLPAGSQAEGARAGLNREERRQARDGRACPHCGPATTSGSAALSATGSGCSSTASRSGTSGTGSTTLGSTHRSGDVVLARGVHRLTLEAPRGPTFRRPGERRRPVRARAAHAEPGGRSETTLGRARVAGESSLRPRAGLDRGARGGVVISVMGSCFLGPGGDLTPMGQVSHVFRLWESR